MPVHHFHKERLSELMQREIASVISHELRDPRIPPILTITRITLGSDQRNATVFFSMFNDQENTEEENKEEVVFALNKAAPYIQRLVASRIVVKQFPKLFFKHDDGVRHTLHINELLKEINDDLGRSEQTD